MLAGRIDPREFELPSGDVFRDSCLDGMVAPVARHRAPLLSVRGPLMDAILESVIYASGDVSVAGGFSLLDSDGPVHGSVGGSWVEPRSDDAAAACVCRREPGVFR